MTIKLAQAIGGAAVRNGVGMARASVLGAGHDVCSAAPFVAGYRPPHNPGWPRPVTYHLNQSGMDGIAKALDDAIGH